MDKLEVRFNQVEYYGHLLDVFVISVNGQVVSETAAGFDARSDKVVLNICEECYAATGGSITCCSPNQIVVRRHGDLIYWLHTGEFYEDPIITEPERRHVWMFSLDNYELQLAASTSELPGFKSADIKLILNRDPLYPRDLGLYVIPDCDEDPQGRRMLDLVAEFADSDELTVVDTPAEFDSYRIGIETPGIPEVRLDIAEVDGQAALRFNARPFFPLWVMAGKRGML